ncbi:MAG: dehydrogenase [Proteobacteria bacterium]|nr:MAG: dehydrogenase [Pseudomonadota bacterium]
MYADFDLKVPDALDDALDALASGNSGGAIPLAGGTNVLIDIRARNIDPDSLISVKKIKSLRGITEKDGKVTVGAATTISDLLRYPDMPRLGSAIMDAGRVFAGQMVRNAATVAGNICCGSPAADTVPPLMVLDAVVTLQSRSGSREVPLSDFFTGFRTNVRESNELITQISWPVPAKNSANLYYKIGRRKGDAITVAGVAVSLGIEDGKCKNARIALGSVAPTVIRATDAEAILEGQALTAELIDTAARKAMDASSPIDDVRATAEYRRQQAYVLSRRLVNQAWETLS